MRCQRIIGSIVLLLAAGCEWQVEKPAAAVVQTDCSAPAAVQAYRSRLDARVAEIIGSRVAADFGDLIDAGKSVSGLELSAVSLNNPAENADSSATVLRCSAQLQVSLERSVYAEARLFSPFVYLPNRYLIEIDNVANANSVARADNIFSVPAEYTLTRGGADIQAAVQERAVTRMAQTLAAALLPYGVKETVVVDGESLSRDNALARVMYPVPDERGSDTAETAAVLPEISAAPDMPALPENTAAAYDRDARMAEYQTSAQDLRILWNSLDETVRASLAEEEERWRADTDSRCAAAKAQTAEDAVLECRIRSVRDRIAYLRGFSID